MAKDAITPEEKIHLLWIQNITMLALLDDATFKIFRDDEVVRQRAAASETTWQKYLLWKDVGQLREERQADREETDRED